MKGLIHIYCGDGKGKTSSALGLAVRAAGANKRVLIIRFLKNNDSGELNSLSYIPNITMISCEKSFGFFWNMTPEQKIEAKETYSNYLQETIQRVKKEQFDVLVMDEVIATYNHEFVDQKEFVDFLSTKPEQLEVILTGRNPAKELLELADYVSNIQKVKHPYDIGIPARDGIEY
ncbi:MAG: cob(I)yrinic acid a,c-diamide adenosyltransferase [Anaerocolumna sp.]